ncbi:CbrC family protein [Larkinella rosea]|uniref:CbrC family protein n=1 Tax=Larkinella rosea TaxID=2025312 RepID=A0A3P1BCM3_9BACT|nr:CbrC family protein [Larkinella rosea]RRA98857.1 hypothetical protein EHT25_28110 [Larkinella rosea]
MIFKYFDKPEIFIGLRDKETHCDLCDQPKLCFDAGAFLGEDEIASICPECLATGRLYELDCYTCQGDVTELKRQLRERHPSLTKAEVDDLADQKTLELEKTTPPLVTWQDWEWPSVDGDYGRFIGYGSRPFYTQLAGDIDAKSLFEKSIYYAQADDTDADEWWQDMPRKTVNDYKASSDYSTLFYVFKSLHSDQIVTIWDTE